MTHTLHLGDCRTVLATLDDASIDAIVCDPPYELGFMGKAWDNSGIAYDVTPCQPSPHRQAVVTHALPRAPRDPQGRQSPRSVYGQWFHGMRRSPRGMRLCRH